jgi:hypothetical protein
VNYQGIKYKAMHEIQLTEDIIAYTLLAAASGYAYPEEEKDEKDDSYVFRKTKKGYRAVHTKYKKRRRTDTSRSSG